MTGFFAGLFILVAGLIAVYWRWSKRIEEEIREGADAEWARLSGDADKSVQGFSKDHFAAVYRKVHFPRFPKYALGIIVAFAAALPIVFVLLGGFLWAADNMGLLAEPAELAKYVPLSDAEDPQKRAYREERALYLAKDFAGFYYYFGVFFAWLGVVAFFMRRYHAHAPGSLREELIRARDDFKDDVVQRGDDPQPA